jgi:hypothetical protein
MELKKYGGKKNIGERIDEGKGCCPFHYPI